MPHDADGSTNNATNPDGVFDAMEPVTPYTTVELAEELSTPRGKHPIRYVPLRFGYENQNRFGVRIATASLKSNQFIQCLGQSDFVLIAGRNAIDNAAHHNFRSFVQAELTGLVRIGGRI